MREFTTGIRKFPSSLQVKNPKSTYEVLREFSDAHVEVLTVIPVSRDLVASEIHVCAIGSMMSVSVEARTVFSGSVFRNDGSGVIVVHNHPFQKDPLPSRGDLEFIRGVRSSGSLIDVPVLDSVIVGEKGFYSFMDHGDVFDKSPEYKMVQMEPYKSSVIKEAQASRGDIRCPKDAYEAFRFLKKEEAPVFAVLHMTPDLEASRIQVFEDARTLSPRAISKMVLREAILHPSTKYIVMGYNCGIFKKRSQYDTDLLDILTHVRLGSTLLCIPLVDVIVMESGSDFYSFMEHGRVIPRSRSYHAVEAEGLRLKSPKKTDRPDIPPYSWTFR